MKSILCLDLDNTLLARSEKEYHRAVLQGLCEQIGGSASDACLKHLQDVIQALTRKENPNETLDEAFFAQFLSLTGLEEREVIDSFYRFYRNSYHKLGEFTRPIPAAIEFVGQVVERGHPIVIATNPIYPEIAIEERLKWAGLSQFQSDFTFITSIEKFHFTKPNPAYYAEILARLGWPENTPVIMVGDSYEMDIQPSYRTGMKTFLLGQNHPPSAVQADCSWGTFSDLLQWIEDEIHTSTNGSSQPHPVDFFSFLRASPAAIHSVCRSIPDAAWRFRPDPNEWSMVEVICHLRDADRHVNIPRFKEAMKEENPFLPSIDTDSWVTDRNYRDEDGSQALREMLDARMNLIELLENFPGDWGDKTARHSIFGPTSLNELLDFIITHDKIHVRQLQKTCNQVRNKMTR